MKKHLLIIAICISSMAFGQVNTKQVNTKMDFYLASKLSLYNAKKVDSHIMLPMLIKGNISTIKSLVISNGGIFKYSYGSIASIVIPVNALAVFNESTAVIRMEGGPPRMHVLDDSSNVKNHIAEILSGQAPLPQAYTGKGVVMGFVDSGIDYLHDDFRDSTGTRVKYYWDMNRYNNQYTPSGYGYGQAWDKAQLDASGTGHTDPNDSSGTADYGHGCNVAGVAVGNGGCNGHQIGGCPQADIIFVAYNFGNQTATMLTDAVNYIYTCADSLNEPCVINASLGSNDGSHDDSDLQGEMIDSMIEAKQGRVFVAAAGNSGVPYHLHDSIKTGDTTFTWFVYDGGIGIVDIPIFANETDFNNVKFRLRCDKVVTGGYTERDTLTVFANISSCMGQSAISSIYNASGQRLAQMQSYGQVYGKGSYSLEFQILPDSTSYYWGFEATGNGRYDIWDYGSIDGIKDTDGLKINPTTYPGIKKYKQPDTLETICSSFQCSPHVITAQTYYNALTFKDCNGTVTTNAGHQPGEYVWTTSRGPTRNYTHMKPDISAAGNYTLAAYPTWYLAKYGCAGEADSLGCHNIDGGTSLASPMVASAVGLYLQRYPHASDSTIWRCITGTAYTDIFTGPSSQLPNYNWGYGKLDAFNALTLCGPTGIPSVYAPNQDFNISAYPNPYSSNTIISYDFSSIKSFSRASIVIYDMMGKEVKTIDLGSSQGTVNMDRNNLSSGMYFYSLMVDGSRLKTEKLEVL